MSDVSKLKINNVTYNIKDSLALRDAPSNGNEYVRKNGTWTIATGGGDGTYLGDSIEFENNSAIITTAEETANEFVKKSGDTMTGDLTLNNHDFRIKKPITNISASSIESAQYAVMGATDINDDFLGYIQATQYTDGSTLIQIAARNKKTGETSTFNNSLGLRCNKDGTKSVTLEKDAWHNALGLTWTKAGSVTGTNTVTVPVTAKEVMAIVRTASSNSVIYTNYCLKAELSSIWVIGGYSIGSSDYGIVNLNVSNSSRTFQIRNARYGAQDYKSSSVLTIYYR